MLVIISYASSDIYCASTMCSNVCLGDFSFCRLCCCCCWLACLKNILYFSCVSLFFSVHGFMAAGLGLFSSRSSARLSLRESPITLFPNGNVRRIPPLCVTRQHSSPSSFFTCSFSFLSFLGRHFFSFSDILSYSLARSSRLFLLRT